MPGGTGGAPRRGGRGEAAGMVALRFLVYGRVQGVGFRWFVLREAKRRGLRGLRRNLRDRAVGVIAAGAEEALEELGRMPQARPAHAQGERVGRSDVPHERVLPNDLRIQ